MPTITQQQTLHYPGGSLNSSRSVSGGGGPNVTNEVLAAEATTRISCPIDVSALKGLVLQSSVDATVTPNKKARETTTVVGTITSSGAGNVLVTVTAADMPSSPKAINVAVANNDSASTVAGKIRAALAADADVTAYWDVSGTGADVVLTTRIPLPTDATQNFAIAEGTSDGLTEDLVSTGSLTTGDTPISLLAGVPYVWVDPSYDALLLTKDVFMLDVQNAGTAAGSFNCHGAADVTP